MQPVGARSALERVFPSTEPDVTDEDVVGILIHRALCVGDVVRHLLRLYRPDNAPKGAYCHSFSFVECLERW